MRSLAIRTLACSLALVLASRHLVAQEHRPGIAEVDDSRRGGAWFALGVGAGAEQVDLDGDGLGYSDRLTKPTVDLRGGGTLGRHLRLGGELFAWINGRGDATESLTHLGLVAQLYPFTRAGLYLKGGVGFGRSAVDFRRGPSVSDWGPSAILGAGWEVRVARKLYIVPAIDLMAQDYGGRAGYREHVGSVSLGVMYQGR